MTEKLPLFLSSFFFRVRVSVSKRSQGSRIQLVFFQHQYQALSEAILSFKDIVDDNIDSLHSCALTLSSPIPLHSHVTIRASLSADCQLAAHLCQFLPWVFFREEGEEFTTPAINIYLFSQLVTLCTHESQGKKQLVLNKVRNCRRYVKKKK